MSDKIQIWTEPFYKITEYDSHEQVQADIVSNEFSYHEMIYTDSNRLYNFVMDIDGSESHEESYIAQSKFK